jgi:hypothetical protein
MKKLLLSCGFGLFASLSFGQVIFSIEEPASIDGNYEFSGPDDGSGWGLTTLVGTSILDTVVLADDGTAGVNAQGNPASATGCNTLPNNSLAGKIAVVFRYDGVGIGECDFGVKAQNAAAAGAVAVIIVNREAGVIAMSGGDAGALVTVPVVMVSLSTGQAIVDALDNGDVVRAFIGDKTGLFDDDLGFMNADVVRPSFYSHPAVLAGAGELTFPLGGYVHNYGQNDQTAVTVSARVMMGGTELYDETTAAGNIVSGDSMWIDLPDFVNTAALTEGEYTVEYAINFAGDEYAGDNTVEHPFRIVDAISAGPTDEDGMPASASFTMPATWADPSFDNCVHFRNANASRIGVDGIYFEATMNTGSLDGLSFQAFAYEWNDNFVDVDDANYGITALEEVASNQEFYIEGDLQDTPIFVPFDEPVVLEDDQRYLFCISSPNPDVFMGFSDEFSYDATYNLERQPIHPLIIGEDFLTIGFVGSPVPTVTARTFPAGSLSVGENFIEAASYPNPAKDVLTVKINAKGDATLVVTDLAGRTVMNSKVTIADGRFTTNVTEMNAGTYIFNLTLADGATSQFKVVVAK